MADHPLQAATDALVKLTGKLEELTGKPEAGRISALATILNVRLELPTSWVTFIGETSSGKSSIINSFLGEDLLPTGAAPTTGTVVRIVFGGPEDGEGDKFEKLYSVGDGDLFYVPGFTRERFQSECRSPGPEVIRLEVYTSRKGRPWEGLQIIDTPGYNSLIAGHQEVLLDFVPNSDVIVLVVGYRTGFGLVEQELLEAVQESLSAADSPAPLALVINRAPQGIQPGDRRMSEIVSHAKDCLHRGFDQFTVPARPTAEGPVQAPLDTVALFRRIMELSLSPEAAGRFSASVKAAIRSICGMSIESLNVTKMSHIAAKDSADRVSGLISSLTSLREECVSVINSSFDDLERDCRIRIDSEFTALKRSISREIQASDKWLDYSQCATYVGSHMIPFGVRKILKETAVFIRAGLEALDKRLEDCVNASISQFKAGAAAKVPEFDDLVESILSQLLSTVISKGIEEIVKKVLAPAVVSEVAGFVGAQAFKGISQAAVKNLASSGSKMAAERLAATLARVNVAVQIAIEAFFLIYDANTWQGDLERKVAETLDREASPETADGALGQILNNLRELRGLNLDNVPVLLESRIAALRESAGETAPDLKIEAADSLIGEFESLRSSLMENRA
ncbi:MAG: dynamin family protein [Deltaproteobacteria bacterium]|jgi:GTPase SAR1 family protein|nr:dynamin family protein [Deltaproteobacteria bacterium]